MNLQPVLLRRLAAVTLILLPACGFAENGGAEFFEKNVRPILQENCFKCHSHAEKIKGGLALDSLEGALSGGETSPAVVPGDVSKSLIIEAVSYKNDDLQMPPKGKRLTEAQISTLQQWITMGAPWPVDSNKKKMISRPKGGITEEDRKWWAFQPVTDPSPPVLEEGGWGANEIDGFIFKKLSEAGLQPAPRASKAKLIRRLYFDLIGLPPSPEQIAAFEADTSPQAWPNLVDSLLASPRYGERWARHWLDLVRYADSDGFRIDDYRPHAWRYRDYVIAAFNDDKPYDRFIQEQLAGDEMFPEEPQAHIATGFLRHWIYEYNNRDVPGQWTNILNDVTDVTADVFMGLGVQCARCHDHKFDPILQKDYFRLQAFFAPILPQETIAATESERNEYARKLIPWQQKTAALREHIATLEAPYRQKAAEDAIIKFPIEIQALIRKPVFERAPLEHQLAELAYRQVDYEFGRLLTHVPDKAKQELIQLQKELTAFDKEKPQPLPVAYEISDAGPVAPPVQIPKKEQLGDIAPGFLSIFDAEPAKIEGREKSTGRRTALARWLTTPDNALVTRVIVNRVWQYHFGQGLVVTSSDFGKLGEPPSHPELLDWMARRFVKDGWSFKKLHRLILLSSTWQEAADAASNSDAASSNAEDSNANPGARNPQLIDPEDRLLWRSRTRRLDAEQIRDAILAATGELDLKNTAGPGVDGSQPRRSIFNKIMRNTHDPLLEVFDMPEGFLSASQRNTTTTPTQSLQMMNGAWPLARARALAQRLQREFPSSDSRPRLTRGFQLTMGRPPTETEAGQLGAFLGAQETRLSGRVVKKTAAPFAGDKMPFRDGRGAVLEPGSAQEQLTVPHGFEPGENGFTVEAFVMLRSLYPNGNVRTIASQWDGVKEHPGWSLGVTGKQSRYKPQTLVLLLNGKGTPHDQAPEPIFSGLSVQVGKPYFVAVSVPAGAAAADQGVTFYLKDLSNDDEPMLVAALPHQTTGGLGATPFTIGGRSGRGANNQHTWDGIIDDVRLSSTALPQEKLLVNNEAAAESTLGYWRFDMGSDPFKDTAPKGHDIVPTIQEGETAEESAWIDLCHVLLNSNEFLYVD